MKEKHYQGPGVFNGLSTNKAYKGKYITIHVDDEAFIEVDLETSLPTDKNVPGYEPEKPLFFKHQLLIKYPQEAEGDMTLFIE